MSALFRMEPQSRRVTAQRFAGQWVTVHVTGQAVATYTGRVIVVALSMAGGADLLILDPTPPHQRAQLYPRAISLATVVKIEPSAP